MAGKAREKCPLHEVYEDLKQEPKTAILKVAPFCGEDDLPDDVIDKIVNDTNSDSMKVNPLVDIVMLGMVLYDSDKSPFNHARKGIAGDWVNYFTEEPSQYIDEHYIATAAEEGLIFNYAVELSPRLLLEPSPEYKPHTWVWGGGCMR